MRVHLVTVPYRYDERADGSGGGPAALLDAGLVERLESLGFDVQGPFEAVLPDEERVDSPIAVNIGRLGSHTAELVAGARGDGAVALVISGDDTAAVGVMSGLQRAHGAGAAIGLAWLDAHGDFNTPETSYSGILAGMPVAILAGLAGPLWRGAAGLAAPVPTDRLLIVGTRDLDEQEARLLRSTDARLVPAAELGDGATFEAAVGRLAARCSHICLHVDLDVLDPSLVPSASTPSANGLSVEDAEAAMATVLRTGQVATLCLTSLNPGAGKRGERSVASALALLERAVTSWERVPERTANGGA